MNVTKLLLLCVLLGASGFISADRPMLVRPEGRGSISQFRARGARRISPHLPPLPLRDGRPRRPASGAAESHMRTKRRLHRAHTAHAPHGRDLASDAGTKAQCGHSPTAMTTASLSPSCAPASEQLTTSQPITLHLCTLSEQKAQCHHSKAHCVKVAEGKPCAVAGSNGKQGSVAASAASPLINGNVLLLDDASAESGRKRNHTDVDIPEALLLVDEILARTQTPTAEPDDVTECEETTRATTERSTQASTNCSRHASVPLWHSPPNDSKSTPPGRPHPHKCRHRHKTRPNTPRAPPSTPCAATPSTTPCVARNHHINHRHHKMPSSANATGCDRKSRQGVKSRESGPRGLLSLLSSLKAASKANPEVSVQDNLTGEWLGILRIGAGERKSEDRSRRGSSERQIEIDNVLRSLGEGVAEGLSRGVGKRQECAASAPTATTPPHACNATPTPTPEPKPTPTPTPTPTTCHTTTSSTTLSHEAILAAIAALEVAETTPDSGCANATHSCGETSNSTTTETTCSSGQATNTSSSTTISTCSSSEALLTSSTTAAPSIAPTSVKTALSSTQTCSTPMPSTTATKTSACETKCSDAATTSCTTAEQSTRVPELSATSAELLVIAAECLPTTSERCSSPEHSEGHKLTRTANGASSCDSTTHACTSEPTTNNHREEHKQITCVNIQTTNHCKGHTNIDSDGDKTIHNTGHKKSSCNKDQSIKNSKDQKHTSSDVHTKHCSAHNSEAKSSNHSEGHKQPGSDQCKTANHSEGHKQPGSDQCQTANHSEGHKQPGSDHCKTANHSEGHKQPGSDQCQTANHSEGHKQPGSDQCHTVNHSSEQDHTSTCAEKETTEHSVCHKQSTCVQSTNHSEAHEQASAEDCQTTNESTERSAAPCDAVPSTNRSSARGRMCAGAREKAQLEQQAARIAMIVGRVIEKAVKDKH